MILSHAEGREDIRLRLVNTARQRKVYDFGLLRRVIFGVIGLFGQVIQVQWQIIRGCGIVHITTSGSLAVYRDLALIRVAKLYGVSIVYHIRFGRVPELARQDTREWRRILRAMRNCDCILAIDAATFDAVRAHLPDVRVARISNCVELSDLPRGHIAGQIKTVVFVGWVIPTKGVTDLIQAWAQLSPLGWRLLIVGPGDPAYVRALQEGYEMNDVEFLGEKSHADAMQILAGAEILVLPSYSEGFPNVVLEAMALDKMVVATCVGAIPEMLGEECGILVSPGDVHALERALARATGDSDLRSRCGEAAGLRVAANYSVESVFSEYTRLWREIRD